MTQSNASPGAHPPSGLVAVAPGVLQHGSADTRAAATLTTVTYAQSEPGANKPKRM